MLFHLTYSQLVLIVLLALGSGSISLGQLSAPPAQQHALLSPELRWRVGVGVSHRNPLQFSWPDNRPGWFHDWDIDIFTLAGGYNQPLPRLALSGDETDLGMEFVPLISTPGDRDLYSADLLAQLARSYPGRTWIVGNEPDVLTQDWATPEQYASAYHRIYGAIKRADPSAVIVAGNLGLVTPLRLKYLDAVVEAYEHRYGAAMPADVWGVHLYVLPEHAGKWGAGLPPGTSDPRGEGMSWTVEQHDELPLIKQQVRSMRAWMNTNGYANHPLWITEYGILMPPEYGFGPQRVAGFLIGTFDLFRTYCDARLGLAADGGHLVQRWNWFSTRAPEYPAGDLFDAAGNPTMVMQAMANYLAEHDSETAAACR